MKHSLAKTFNHVTIRKARPSDMPQVLAVEEACFPANKYEPGLMASHLKNDSTQTGVRASVLFVAVAADAERPGKEKVLGYALGVHQPDDTGRLARLGVGPEAAGKGLGRKLLQRIYTNLQDLGAHKHISLEVRESNAVAIGLYLSEGFIISRKLPGHYGVENGLKMIRPLEKKSGTAQHRRQHRPRA